MNELLQELKSEVDRLIGFDHGSELQHALAGVKISTLESVINRLEKSLESQWQPIETYDVSKHPENVLLLCTTLERTNHKTTSPFIIEGWLDKDNEWQCDLTWVLDGLKPIYWLPLPQLPKQ